MRFTTHRKGIRRWHVLAGGAALVMAAQVVGLAAITSASAFQTNLPFQGLSQPNGLAESGGDFFAADTNNNRVLELIGTHQTTLPFVGLSSPKGVAVGRVTSNNELAAFVADTGNNRIVELNLATGVQTTLPFVGLRAPAGVAAYYDTNIRTSSAVDVFVADTGNNRIVELNLGTGVQTALPFVGLSQPRDVALDTNRVFGVYEDTTTTPDLVVTDTNNNRVVQLDGFTAPQFALRLQGLNQPGYLTTCDFGDVVFVSDTNNNRVVELFDGHQSSIGNIGLSRPEGVAAPAQSGSIYTSDTQNNRVVRAGATVGC